MDNGSESAKVQRDPCDGSSVRGHQLEVRRFDHSAPAPGDHYGWLTENELAWHAIVHAGPEPFSWPLGRWFDDPTSLPLGTTPSHPTHATTHAP